MYLNSPAVSEICIPQSLAPYLCQIGFVFGPWAAHMEQMGNDRNVAQLKVQAVP